MGIMPGKYSLLDESDVVLIETVKTNPALYNPKHRDYYSVCKKREYWRNIAQTLRMPQWEVCRRWTCLRKRYVRGLRQLVHNPDRTDICNTELYKRMNFLKTFIRNHSEYYENHVGEYTETTSKNDTLDIVATLKPFIHFNNATPVATDATTTMVVNLNQASLNYPANPSEVPADLLNNENLCNNNNDCHACREEEHNSINEKDICSAHNFCIDFMENIKKMEDTTISKLDIRNNRENDIENINMGNSLSTENLLNNSIVTTNTTTNQLQCMEEMSLGVGQNTNSSNTAKVYVTIPPRNESDECFSKTIASYLKKLPLRHKIKAEIEIMQILKTYIEMEDIE